MVALILLINKTTVNTFSYCEIISHCQGWVFAIKLFLPGQWKKPVKTVTKTSKNRQKLAKSKTP